MIYHSNLAAPDLSPQFQMVSYPRDFSFGHDVPADPDSPECGWFTHDEAAILYECARRVRGVWADIGARVGWTTAHLLAAGCRVIAVDPALEDPGMNAKFWRNVAGEGPRDVDRVIVQPIQAHQFFAYDQFRYAGFCIDGDHDSPQPLHDAKQAAALAEPTCVMILHDTYGKPIQDAIAWLARNGWGVAPYFTPNGMAVCWRGSFVPPPHDPDETIFREKSK